MDSAAAAADFSPTTGGATQPASHSATVADGSFSHQQQPQPTE